MESGDYICFILCETQGQKFNVKLKCCRKGLSRNLADNLYPTKENQEAQNIVKNAKKQDKLLKKEQRFNCDYYLDNSSLCTNNKFKIKQLRFIINTCIQ